MDKWFGSSGVRGSYDVISPEFALKLGIAVGKVFNLQKPVFIASDMRATGDPDNAGRASPPNRPWSHCPPP